MKRITKPYEYNGYRGLSAIANAHQIPLGTLKGRVRRGLSIAEAICHRDLREFNTGEAVYEWRGEKGIRAIAKKAGVSQMAIFSHLKHGKDLDQAIESILKTKAKVIKNKKAPDVQEKHLGIKRPDMMSATWRLALGVLA
ncbi:hypothetical protein [Vibrio hepatarius]|uniref:hypothetical protein n=1 Tax=Vibrio hepatarius TaxID=171383 RepID=UPI001C09AC2E|nr:hypothetical protein [Vibrio hepatarius]MBU2898030.1 hypothetical protein [Vibrio hepatarius]